MAKATKKRTRPNMNDIDWLIDAAQELIDGLIDGEATKDKFTQWNEVKRLARSSDKPKKARR